MEKSGNGKISTVPKIFLDTNILVYTVDSHDRKKQAFARNIIKEVVEKDIPVISTQVLQEFYSATTTKLRLDKLIAKNIMHNYHNIEIVQIDLDLIEQGIDISILSQISFGDGLIIASAEQANCSFIFSEDLNSGQTIRGIKIVNPFNSNS